MTHTVDGSLEASEWSSDSMAAGRSRSMDGVSMMPPPKSGVAVAWNLGGPGELFHQLVVGHMYFFAL